jgi:ABC-type lipoprotein release transport system permease subunit
MQDTWLSEGYDLLPKLGQLNPLTFSGVALLMCLSPVTSPSRRASTIDPVLALRAE